MNSLTWLRTACTAGFLLTGAASVMCQTTSFNPNTTPATPRPSVAGSTEFGVRPVTGGTASWTGGKEEFDRGRPTTGIWVEKGGGFSGSGASSFPGTTSAFPATSGFPASTSGFPATAGFPSSRSAFPDTFSSGFPSVPATPSVGGRVSRSGRSVGPGSGVVHGLRPAGVSHGRSMSPLASGAAVSTAGSRSSRSHRDTGLGLSNARIRPSLPGAKRLK